MEHFLEALIEIAIAVGSESKKGCMWVIILTLLSIVGTIIYFKYF